MSRSTITPTSAFSKLPPIITSEADRVLLHELNEYIDHELCKIDSDEGEQRYTIYKTVFNKIIEHVAAYKPLLTSIKKEYEDTIEAIKKAQREAAFLHGKLKSMASEPSTIRNYRKRADELEERLSIVRKDNERLQTELQTLKAKREEREIQEKEVLEPPPKEWKKDNRLIPGLSLEESTDLNLLDKKLDQLDRQYRELMNSFKTRYVPKSRKIELKENLDNKVNYRDHLLRQGQFYKAKRYRLKIAMEAAQAYNRVKPPHQTVGDAVIRTLSQAQRGNIQEKEPNPDQNQGEGVPREGTPTVTASASTFEDDDPNKEKEAEMMLEYIEKFNELFEDGKYEEAAIHASNSPKGILRTSQTLAKFRDVKVKVHGRTPLLAFCDSLMATVGALNSRPNNLLSAECVECALKENKLDLLSHWIAQNRLSLTQDIGHMIRDHCQCKVPCKCSCQALAQNVYARLRQHHDAALCLLRQGRVQAGLEYARLKAPFNRESYIEALRAAPSLLLLSSLVTENEKGVRPIPLGVAIRTLVEANKLNLCLPFMQELQNTPSAGDPQTTAFQAAVLDDTETSIDDWYDLVELFQQKGCKETAVSLMAAVTVLSAMRSALQQSQDS